MAGRGSTAKLIAGRIAVDGCGALGETRVPMRVYRFHCVGADDAVFDLRGKRLPTPAQVRRHAEQVAGRLMAGAQGEDWATWHVEVYDAAGRRIWERAFTEIREGGRRG